MAEPLTLTLTILGVIGRCTNTTQSLYTLQSHLRAAPAIISDFENEISILSSALHRIQTIVATGRPFSHSLLEPFDTALLGCTQVISSLDLEISKLNGTANEDEEQRSRGKRFITAVRYVWNEDVFQDLLRRLRGQQSALYLLLQGFQMERQEDIYQLLLNQAPQLQVTGPVPPIREASYAASTNPPSSIGTWKSTSSFDGESFVADSAFGPPESSIGSEIFAFDDVVVNSTVYRRAMKYAQSGKPRPRKGRRPRILEDLDPEENLIDFSDADNTTETQDLQSMGELMLEERVEKPNEKRELGGINEEQRFILLSAERDEFEAMPGTGIEREMTFEHDDHSDAETIVPERTSLQSTIVPQDLQNLTELMPQAGEGTHPFRLGIYKPFETIEDAEDAVRRLVLPAQRGKECKQPASTQEKIVFPFMVSEVFSDSTRTSIQSAETDGPSDWKIGRQVLVQQVRRGILPMFRGQSSIEQHAKRNKSHVAKDLKREFDKNIKRERAKRAEAARAHTEAEARAIPQASAKSQTIEPQSLTEPSRPRLPKHVSGDFRRPTAGLDYWGKSSHPTPAQQAGRKRLTRGKNYHYREHARSLELLAEADVKKNVAPTGASPDSIFFSRTAVASTARKQTSDCSYLPAGYYAKSDVAAPSRPLDPLTGRLYDRKPRDDISRSNGNSSRNSHQAGLASTLSKPPDSSDTSSVRPYLDDLFDAEVPASSRTLDMPRNGNEKREANVFRKKSGKDAKSRVICQDTDHSGTIYNEPHQGRNSTVSIYGGFAY